MAEYIEKWSVVDRLIDIENEFQQYKRFTVLNTLCIVRFAKQKLRLGRHRPPMLPRCGMGSRKLIQICLIH